MDQSVSPYLFKEDNRHCEAMDKCVSLSSVYHLENTLDTVDQCVSLSNVYTVEQEIATIMVFVSCKMKQ